jgi:hypothetical protein
MNLTHAIRRPAGNALWLATVIVVSLTAAPAALATPRPRPPGWNKHPPLPAHAHSLATGAIPGWQLTLMAVTIILLVAVVMWIAYPGPGRMAASAPSHRLSGDRMPRHADPERQPAALARPAPGRNHQACRRP